jgi:hypothetical protein
MHIVWKVGAATKLARGCCHCHRLSREPMAVPHPCKPCLHNVLVKRSPPALGNRPGEFRCCSGWTVAMAQGPLQTPLSLERQDNVYVTIDPKTPTQWVVSAIPRATPSPLGSWAGAKRTRTEGYPQSSSPPPRSAIQIHFFTSCRGRPSCICTPPPQTTPDFSGPCSLPRF